MKAIENISGDETTFTPDAPVQQVTIGNFPADNANFSRAIQLSQEALYIKRVGYAVAIPIENLLPLAITIEPGLTYPPLITTNPENDSVAVNDPANFTIVAAVEFPATDTISYQWQESTDAGINFTDITDGGDYSGATTATLTVTPSSADMDQYQYRCVATAGSGSTESTAAILTVTA